MEKDPRSRKQKLKDDFDEELYIENYFDALEGIQ